MKHLGLDFGTRRVGVAMSDPFGRLVFPLKTLYTVSQRQVADEVAALVVEHGVEAVVVGLPLHPPDEDGQEPLSLRQARNFVARLRRRLAVPVHTVDETLTSAAARDDLRQLDARRQRQVLDQQAAAHLLRRHLGVDPGEMHDPGEMRDPDEIRDPGDNRAPGEPHTLD